MSVNNKCIWCGAEEFKEVCKRKDSIRVLQCTKCNLKQLESILENINSIYTDDYFKKNDNNSTPSIGYFDYYNAPLYTFLWQYAFVNLVVENRKSKLLDIGCASGKFIEIMETAGFSTTGIDISIDAIRRSKLKNLHVYTGTLEQFPLKNEKYDVITAWDLMEHLVNIKDFLYECKLRLKSDGVLIFSTPDAGAKIALDKGEKWVGYNSSLEHITYLDNDFIKGAFKEVFQAEPIIFSFTYGEYSTIIGYIRMSGITSEDKILESYISNLTYPDNIQKELDKILLLSILYLHFEVNINNIKMINNMVQCSSPAAKRFLLSSMICLKEGNYQESVELLSKASNIEYKDLLILRIFNEVLQEYHCKEADNKQMVITSLTNQISEKDLERSKLERLISEKNEELISAKINISAIEDQLKAKAMDNAHLKETISQRESSLSWRFSQYYGKYFSVNSPITQFLSYILKKVLGTRTQKAIISTSTSKQMTGTRNTQSTPSLDLLLKFLDENNDKELCVVFSGTKFIENEGQRTLRLAQEFSKKGFIVVFASWRWNEQEALEYGLVSPGIFQIPIDMFINNAAKILGYPRTRRKILLIEFPHPSLFGILSLANSNGWITIYDVLDDWESFHKVGQAIWYRKDIEAYVAHNSDIITTVSPGLLDKLRKDFKCETLRVVPNALSPNVLGRTDGIIKNSSLPRGSITIGYFGHLTPAWFDWDLVISTAKRNPDWIFHIIGYGKPEKLVLPNNMIFLGKVNPKELAGFAANWDVAIIPFKVMELSKFVDPIKIYEYLYLGLPVVVTGIYHIAQYPYVWIAHSSEEFEENIIRASGVSLDKDRIAAFVAENTWDKRVEDMINMISEVKQICPLKVE